MSPAVDPRHAVLFEPVPLGPKVLPNRFYQVPHASGFGSARPHAQAAFREVKAEGGWGGVCVEYSPVSVDSEEAPFVAAYLRDERDARALRLTAEAIHAHGALAGVELYHGGASSNNVRAREPRVAPTGTAARAKWGSQPRTMGLDDIARVQADFVAGARLARDAGFDIVYVYGAHGYLLTQFLSTVLNRRQDGYGGPLAHRARFALEALEQVRAAVGEDCAVATRICIDGREGIPGVELDDMLEFVRLADPLVDLFDVTVGSWPEDSGTSRYYAEGHELPWSSRVHEATARPVVGVGRFTSPDEMARVVRQGWLDIIGAARPAIADPFLPRKVAEGRLEDIRECTGANVCILREEEFGQIGCLQNPTAGEEFRRGWHPERVPPLDDPSISVLVVGAGPAGLECALVLAQRGAAAVHLVEADDHVGGSLAWARRLPTLGEWGRAVDWRVVQLARQPAVEVITGRRMGVADVLEYGADVVVLATGSTWDRGTGLSPEDVMAGARPPGPRVVVVDADGYYVGPGIAELLARDGHDVVLATPHDVVSPVSDGTLEGRMLRRHLHRAGVGSVTGVSITHLSDGHARGTDAFGDPVAIPADGLVMVTHREPQDGLHAALIAMPDALAAAGIRAVHLVGDAVAPGWISEAVFAGHRLARELESPDPVPVRREPLA